MRWRALAVVSLGVNFLLAALWISTSRHSGAGNRGGTTGQALAGTTTTNVAIRRQPFKWSEVESPDYPTYIANLRYIGCPDQTIRDIIIADVNNLYSRRLATELITPEQQWWRPEPDTNVLAAAEVKLRALDDERRALLVRLLGPNWESGDLVSLPRPSHPGVLLDGPVLGELSTEIKQAVQNISGQSEERLQAYLAAQRAAGKTPDPVELAKLQQQTRDDLARVLSPPQLEEYLLRYSQEANNLREAFGELKFFNPTPDEFRAVFRATDSIDRQLQQLADSTDPNSEQTRRSLMAQRENLIKNALGARRYAEFQALHDPLYRDAVAAADEAGTPEAARTIYQIKLAALSTQDDINANTNLDADQRAIEMKQLELDQLKANTLATGRLLPPEPQPPVRPRTYTLRPGDSPAIIGMIYGVPESAIRAANPNVDFNRIRPGDSILIPRNAMSPRTQVPLPQGQ